MISRLLLLFLFLSACETEQTPASAPVNKLPEEIQSLAILVFLAEQEAEIWAVNKDQKTRLKKADIQCSFNIPIGIFEYQKDQGVVFPNNFYKEKVQSVLNTNSFYQLAIRDLNRLNKNLFESIKDTSASSSPLIDRLVIVPNDARGQNHFQALPNPFAWSVEYHPQLLQILQQYPK